MNENIPPIDVADDDRQAMSDLEVLGVRAKWKPTSDLRCFETPVSAIWSVAH